MAYRPTFGYPFSLYVSDPYAPILAREYYELLNKDFDRAPDAFIPEKHLTVVKKAVKKGNRFLKAVTTLHRIAGMNPARGKDVGWAGS